MKSQLVLVRVLLLGALGSSWLACGRKDGAGADPGDRADGNFSASSAKQPESSPSPEHGARSVPPAHPDPLVNPPRLFEKPPQDPTAIAPGETLTRHLEAEPGSLNPLFYSSRYDAWLVECLFDGPFKADSRMRWMVNEEIVESSSRSPDGKIWTIRLRPGLTFHDGHALTAHDIEFTWRTIVDDRVPVGAMRGGRDKLAEVKAGDELTVVYVHKEVHAANTWDMSFPILPRHILGDEKERAADPTLRESDHYQKFAYEKPIGSGPYRLVEWERGGRIVLERFDGFQGVKPHFKRVIFKLVANRDSALNLFLEGELDEMRLDPIQFETQTEGDDFEKVGVKAYAPSWTYYFIGWNNARSHPLFFDRRVRIAMAHAFDVPKLIRRHCYGLYDQAVGLFHRSSWMFDPSVEAYAHDVGAAERLLDKADWKLSDEDGLRYKAIDGKRVPFRFTVLFPNAAKLAPKVAELLREGLEPLGITVDIEALDFGAMRQRLRVHDFDAFILGWGTGTDPETARNLWHSKSSTGSGRNYVSYSNPRVDELFDLGRAELDPPKRGPIYREMHRLVYQDQPYLFLCHVPTTWAFSKRLRGVAFSPRGILSFFPGHREWWVHKEDASR